MEKYAEDIPRMRENGVAFRPLVFSADGVPHPAVLRTLTHTADQAARKCGAMSSRRGFVTRWLHEATVACLRRRGAMYRECLPDAKDRRHFLLYGRPRGERPSPSGRHGEGRARPLRTDDDEAEERLRELDFEAEEEWGSDGTTSEPEAEVATEGRAAAGRAAAAAGP